EDLQIGEVRLVEGDVAADVLQDRGVDGGAELRRAFAVEVERSVGVRAAGQVVAVEIVAAVVSYRLARCSGRGIDVLLDEDLDVVLVEVTLAVDVENGQAHRS